MLDHVFGTSSLLPSAKFDVVHLNVDFPRTFINTTASDHEPLLASFNPLPALDQELFRAFMVVAAVGTVLTAGYMLWMLRSVNFGEPSAKWLSADLEDVDTIEWVAWAPLVVGIIAIGIYPKLVFGATDDAVINLITRAFGG